MSVRLSTKKCKTLVDILLVFSAVVLVILIKKREPVNPVANSRKYFNYTDLPAYDDEKLEFARFQEYLAYIQYDCSQKVFASKNSKSFPTCFDRQVLRLWNESQAKLISVARDTNDLDTFEDKFLWIPSQNSHRIITSNRFCKNLLENDNVLVSGPFLEFKHLLEKAGHSLFHFILKIDTTALANDPEIQVACLEALLSLQVSFSRQIISHVHLVLQTPARPNALFWRRWTFFLHSAFYRHNLAVFWSTELGACGTGERNSGLEAGASIYTFNRCEYKISLLRLLLAEMPGVLAPIAGLGSPAEEYQRLVGYLNFHLNPSSYYDRLHKIHHSNERCKLFILNSTFTSMRDDAYFDELCGDKVYVDVATGNANVVAEHLFNKPFHDQIQKFIPSRNSSKLHAFHLYADFDFLVHSNSRQSVDFTQFSVVRSSFSLWLGEDNESYRKIFTFFMFMDRMNFRVYLVDIVGADFVYDLLWVKVKNDR